jgi:hypothetical protein
MDMDVWRGTGERDVGVRRRVSDNRHTSNQPRLARAPRGALRGLRLPVSPATFARRPVRRSPASRSAVSRLLASTCVASPSPIVELRSGLFVDFD